MLQTKLMTESIRCYLNRRSYKHSKLNTSQIEGFVVTALVSSERFVLLKDINVF